MALPECPPNLKGIQPYLKIALEHDQRDLVVAYWARVYSLQLGIKISKLPDEKAFLIKMMDWLENVKKSNKENESISNDTVAQAYLENYAHKLFSFADQQDRASSFGKNVVKAFYTSSMIYDIIQTFGELSVEAIQCRKYAKWKAAYIHNCLKNGETPHPGPLPTEEDDELTDLNSAENNAGQNFGMGWTNPTVPHQPTSISPSVPYNLPANIPSDIDPFKVVRSLPDPPTDPEESKNPGGFVPFNPATSDLPSFQPTTDGGTSRTPEQVIKAQKYCRFASSALTYDDVPTAIENLQKALKILQTGQD